MAYTSPRLDEAALRRRCRAHADRAHPRASQASWRNDSEIGQINAVPVKPVKVGDETLSVIQRASGPEDLRACSTSRFTRSATSGIRRRGAVDPGAGRQDGGRKKLVAITGQIDDRERP